MLARIRRLPFWCLTISTLVAPPAAFEAQVATGDTTVYGVGNDTCESWLADRNKTAPAGELAAREAWVLGFVEGADSYLILSDSSSASIFAGITRFCSGSPRNTVSDAARAVVETLKLEMRRPSSAPHSYYRSSCRKWIEDRRAGNTPQSLNPLSWLTAFVTASLQYGGPAKDMEASAMEAWATRYCSTHVLDSLHEASAALVRELRSP